MAEWGDFRPTALLERLTDARVDFVVIGGVAVTVQASARFTKDLDICYASDTGNLQRLGQLLIDLGATLRGVEEDLPFVPDERTLARTQILTLSTDLGGLDLLVDPAGSPGWKALRRHADVIELAGREVRIAAIDDLLSMKRAAGRPQDLLDVEALETAKRTRPQARRRRPPRPR